VSPTMRDKVAPVPVRMVVALHHPLGIAQKLKCQNDLSYYHQSDYTNQTLSLLSSGSYDFISFEYELLQFLSHVVVVV